MASSALEHPRVVSRAEWLVARKAHLAREKELTRAYDELSKQRRELPWIKVEKPYTFDGPWGKETLAELFDERSQLIINHFMFGPGWKEGCVGCSFGADHVDGMLTHLENHDVSYVAVSRAPLAEIQAFQKRMGWHFKWVSSFESDFNFDYNVSFRPEDVADGKINYNYELRDFEIEELAGLSVFYKGGNDELFHTYSCFARGSEKGAGTYMHLDLTPKGRNENGPDFGLTDWVRHHDRYGAGGSVHATGRYQPAEEKSSCCHSMEEKK